MMLVSVDFTQNIVYIKMNEMQAIDWFGSIRKFRKLSENSFCLKETVIDQRCNSVKVKNKQSKITQVTRPWLEAIRGPPDLESKTLPTEPLTPIDMWRRNCKVLIADNGCTFIGRWPIQTIKFKCLILKISEKVFGRWIYHKSIFQILCSEYLCGVLKYEKRLLLRRRAHDAIF